MGSKQEIILYKNAVQAKLEEQFSGLTVTAFKRIEDDFNVPAIVVSPPVMEPVFNGPKVEGKITMNLLNSAFVCYAAVDENEYSCIETSAYVANFIQNNTWGLKDAEIKVNVTPANVTSVEPVIIKDLESFVFQKIDFEQQITITENQ